MNIPTRNSWTIAPCVCRLLAKIKDQRTGEWRLMTDDELMAITGWGEKHLRWIYSKPSWDKVSNGDTDLFLHACGLIVQDQRRYKYRLIRALKRGGIHTMRHLQGKRAWRVNQNRTLLRMCERSLSSEQLSSEPHQ